jgi:putative beta-lysine N-acetyltransferase
MTAATAPQGAPGDTDVITQLGGATIQHGPRNRRIYVMKLGRADPAALTRKLEALAEREGYTKVFAKVPARHRQTFARAGYEVEAEVPGYYPDDGGLFLGRYLEPDRAIDPHADETARNLAIAHSKVGAPLPDLPASVTLRPATPADADAMAEVYREVFPSYPFPIDDPAYLRDTMATHVRYMLAHDDGALVAIASAEQDLAAGAAEMTDFATLPSQRGRGLAGHLLRALEARARDWGIRLAYTIARAYSVGMNVTFARLGYTFAGTLTNNTDIFGAIESMNVWYHPFGRLRG